MARETDIQKGILEDLQKKDREKNYIFKVIFDVWQEIERKKKHIRDYIWCLTGEHIFEMIIDARQLKDRELKAHKLSYFYLFASKDRNNIPWLAEKYKHHNFSRHPLIYESPVSMINTPMQKALESKMRPKRNVHWTKADQKLEMYKKKKTLSWFPTSTPYTPMEDTWTI